MQPQVAVKYKSVQVVSGRPAGTLRWNAPMSRSMSRSGGWRVWTGHRGLKLQGSTFLNELSRLAKELDLEDIASWPNQKSPPVTLCHAPVTLPGGALCGLGFAHFATFSVRGATMSKTLGNLRLHVAPQASYLFR